jgi:hypothetical protein
MRRLLNLLTVVPRLGITNVLTVVVYRVALRIRVHPVQRLEITKPGKLFFSLPGVLAASDLQVVEAWTTESRYFGWLCESIGETAPDWMRNPLTNARSSLGDRPWWLISDFDRQLGDIKGVWEASRFGWVLPFAQRAARGDAESLKRLNHWLADWAKKNPTYLGPNWKCGQEASIRVLHIAAAALILHQVKNANTDLLDFVRAHLARIAPTIRYAIAQDNNHGTSEAAALFVGGAWLVSNGRRDGYRWMQLGRRWLEQRAATLIEPDGSFSQYSVNYHRLMLDTYSFVYIWRARLGQAEFSPQLRSRLVAATEWLRVMVSDVTGDTPNVGANDGTHILRLTNTGYRDYRPSVQLASAVFVGVRAYAGEGIWNDGLRWLSVPIPQNTSPPAKSTLFNDGGYAALRRGQAFALLRYPRFRFRPSQSDALHLDFWINGLNLLRDAGSFSYNADERLINYFGGTVGHNTIEFDGRDQMQRLSRFLFGNWPRAVDIKSLCETHEAVEFAAAYRDYRSAYHYRNVRLTEDLLMVNDRIAGRFSNAILRWRLAPGEWKLDVRQGMATLTSKDYPSITLQVSSGINPENVSLIHGLESRYYYKKREVPVLEVRLGKQGNLVTEIRWSS